MNTPSNTPLSHTTRLQLPRLRTSAVTSCVLLAAAALFGSACGDDDGTSVSNSSSSSASSSGAGGMAGAGGGAAGGAGGAGGGSSEEFAVLVRGELFTTDLAEAKMTHDAVAAGGEEQAKAAGDFGHDAMLGTTLLGTTQDAFLGIDRWNDVTAAQMFYQDPAIAQAFGMLFAAPPNVEIFRHVQWYGWGDLQSGDVHDTHWFVVVRGRLAESDIDMAQAAHDPIAEGGEMPAMAAGDIAHVVHLGVADPQEFFAVDIWQDDTNLEAFYSDPAFIMAFGSLFSAPPTVQVYRSTDWHQW